MWSDARNGGRGLTTAAGDLACGHCGGHLAARQEYCLSCGGRIAGFRRLGPVPAGGARVLRRAVVLVAVAAIGAGAAIVLTRAGPIEPGLVTAIGGNVAIPAIRAEKGDLTPWPAKRSGWTVVLVSVPKSQGKDEAEAVASAALSRSLPKVGILDSSRYPSAHPGFWLVFSGIYASEAEATGSLRAARALTKTARVQHIAQ